MTRIIEINKCAQCPYSSGERRVWECTHDSGAHRPIDPFFSAIPDWCPLPESGWHRPGDKPPTDGEWVNVWYQGTEAGEGRMVKVARGQFPDRRGYLKERVAWGNWFATPDWWRPLGELPPGVEG